MTDHKASEPTPRTEASETPRTDAISRLVREYGLSLHSTEDHFALRDAIYNGIANLERELSDLTRKLAESEDKRKVDIRFCHHCSVNGQAHLIRAAFPEVFK